MMYGSWDMKLNRINVFVILGNFLPFYTPTSQIKIWKKWKKHLDVSSFNTSVPKIMIICYIAPEIWHLADVIVIFYFGLYLPLYCLTDWQMKISKKWRQKTPGGIILHKRTKNHHMQYCSWDMVHDRCNYFSFWAIFCPFTI